MKKDKERLREEALRIAWDSLQSHLPWTYKKSSEETDFHKKCVRDYLRLMHLIAEL